jgi:CPA2 family monovalent cation:H+ antiporter-2
MTPLGTEGLQTALVLLATAVLVVAVCRSLGLPPLIGYLMVGVAIGPHALRWVADTAETRSLAEFGVVFLMFTLGLEFNLAKLFQMRRVVLGLGGLQVVVTGSVVAACFIALHESWRAAVTLAAMLTVSSTAIVSRLLAERRELETPHGREAIGVLLFQDLAVVPMLIILPALAGKPEQLAGELLGASVKAAVVLTVLLFVGQRVMRPLFHAVAARRSSELFIISVLLVALGLAYVTQSAGLSLALGAFVAGMLISETEYRHQVEDDIKPFREVLLGLFFITMGMRLDLDKVAANLLLVSLLFVGQIALKAAVVAAISRLLGATTGTAVRSALALAQAGEFGLVLAAVAADSGLVSQALLQPVVASMLLSMFVGPLLIQVSDRLVMRLVGSEWLMQSLALTRLASRTLDTEGHVVICGYGRTGQALARFLEQESIVYIALDLDPERVREADAAGERVVYGDGSNRQTLLLAGVHRAAAMVITFADTSSALKVLAHVRELAPQLPVIVRTLDDADLDRLTAAGATEVVPETFESSLMLASHALVLLGVPVMRVIARVRSTRDERYSLLRGFFHGASDDADHLDEASQLRMHSVVLGGDAYGIGRTLGELAVERYHARVSAVRGAGGRINAPAPSTLLEDGNVVVLTGSAEAVAAAEMRLLQGTL